MSRIVHRWVWASELGALVHATMAAPPPGQYLHPVIVANSLYVLSQCAGQLVDAPAQDRAKADARERSELILKADLFGRVPCDGHYLNGPGKIYTYCDTCRERGPDFVNEGDECREKVQAL